MKDRTKKLIKIGGLAAALALIGGTFAFTNIGQSVLNITEDTNRPERVSMTTLTMNQATRTSSLKTLDKLLSLSVCS